MTCLLSFSWFQVRLGWHDAGTYDKNISEWPKCGGANGSLRFEIELKHAANAGNVSAPLVIFCFMMREHMILILILLQVLWMLWSWSNPSRTNMQVSLMEICFSLPVLQPLRSFMALQPTDDHSKNASWFIVMRLFWFSHISGSWWSQNSHDLWKGWCCCPWTMPTRGETPWLVTRFRNPAYCIWRFSLCLIQCLEHRTSCCTFSFIWY